MDWGSIIIAGLAGGIGGGLGVLLSTMIGKLFRLNDKSAVRIGVMVIFVVGAINLLPPVLDRYLGEYVRWVLPTPDYYTELEADPFWHRILQDHPELKEILKDRLDTAYRKGGEDAVALALAKFGTEVGATFIVEYMARAREDKIPSMIKYYVDSLDSMSKLERPLCYYWFFNIPAMSTDELKQMGSIAGDGGVFLSVIETAYNETPPFDQIRAEELRGQALAAIQDRYGDIASAYLLGTVVPKNFNQEKMYCAVHYDLYKFMQDLDTNDQTTFFRFIFSGAGS